MASGPYASSVQGFLRGLAEAGYVDGQNVTVVYRWAEGHYDRLPALATDLVRQHVAVILATGSAAPALAAKDATSEIPVVFVTGGEPVAAGLVASLSHPGGNLTGISLIFSRLVPKRLDLLVQLVPGAKAFGALLNPSHPEAEFQLRELRDTATTLGHAIQIFEAASPAEIDTVFAGLAEHRIDALLVANDPFFGSVREQITSLAAQHAIPAIYPGREFVEAGGLMSYGPSLEDALRQAGLYVGRIIKGARPADLPVVQPTKFEMTINAAAAKALGLTVPLALLAQADEVFD